VAKQMNRLTAIEVERSTFKEGLHHDGGGLFVKVTPAGSKSFCFRYKVGGKQKTIGLGGYHKTANTLAMARNKAARLRADRSNGLDPHEEKMSKARAVALEEAQAKTFKECAEAYLSTFEASWRSPKHRENWRNSLTNHVYAEMGTVAVSKVSVDHVMKVLRDLWMAKPDTAARVRGRIETVLDWSKVQGYRSGENPAALRGNLMHLLPKLSKVRKVEHFAAMPFGDVPAFYARLRESDGLAARALALAILTACRTSEVLGARWSEFDLKAKVWAIPAERMKAGRAHRVPLAPAALALVKTLPKDESGFLFPDNRRGKPISNMSMLMVLRRRKLEVTTHGFRSTFSDWAAETTPYPREVVEMALAHAIANQVEAAYRRGDLFEKRRALMNDWASFVTSDTVTDRIKKASKARESA
jgi:integrase